MLEMITLDEAQNIINQYIPELEKEEKNLMDAHEYVLAKDVYAKVNQPPFDRSPLDGYALKANDTLGATRDNPTKLKVIGEVCAGGYIDKEVKSGEAIRIMTGAPIPKGADCIIRQEDTDEGEEIVNIYKKLNSYDNYCYAGEDIKKDSLVIREGTFLDHIKIGVLGSIGVDKVTVYKKLKVGIMTTGDELVSVGQPLGPGKIYNSNLFTLSMRLKELYTQSVIINIKKDCEEEISKSIDETINNVDFIITTGGASVGKKDLIKEAVRKSGANILFWKVNIKPGTPIICSELNNKLIISLSGNPAAASVTFEVLVRNYIKNINKISKIEANTKSAIFTGEYNKKSIRTRFLRGTCEYKEGQLYVKLSKGVQSSGVLSSSLNSNCLIKILPGTKELLNGHEVDVILL